MKKILLILLILPFLSFHKQGVAFTPRSFYAEMKALEKPTKVNAIGFVQSATQTLGFSVTSRTITLSSTSTVNNLVLVHVAIYISLGDATITSVTDDVGNTYQIGTPVVNSGILRVYQVMGLQLTGGASVITVTVSPATLIRVGADEYSGFSGAANNAAIYDASASGTGNGTSLSTSTLTSAASGELIVCTGGHASIVTWTAGSGFTQTQSSSGLNSQYNLSGSTSETGPWTVGTSGQWAELISSYKAPAGATNTTNFFQFF
jgi:hypothetical protein